MDLELLQQLASPDIAIRQAAHDSYSATDSQDLEVQLASVLVDIRQGDPNRKAAAAALGYLQNEASRKILLNALTHADAPVRSYAADGLSHGPHINSVHPLITALADRVNTVRNSAERALLEQIPLVTKVGVDALLDLIRNPNPLTRSPAARLLGLTTSEKAFPVLQEILTSDPEWLSRMWAAKALGDLGRQEAAPFLKQALETDQKNRVRAASAEAIGKLKPPEGDGWLLRAIDEDDDGGVRKMASEALRLYGIDLPDDETDDPLDDLAERSQ